MTTRSVTQVGAESGPGTYAMRVLPTCALVALAVAAAWHTHGSIASRDWVGYAVLVALVLAVVAATGAALRPSRWTAASAGCLVGLAGWDALSIRWSPSPSLARDEALLTLLYAIAVLVPATSLVSRLDRRLAFALLTTALGGVAVATAVELLHVRSIDSVYLYRRLDFPVSYSNAEAAFALLAFWPGIALAASRTAPVILRGAALAAAAAAAGTWALAQSKGGGLGLAVSTVVVFAVYRRRLRLAVPFAVVAAGTAVTFRSLSAPYRTYDAATVHRAAWIELGLVAVAFVCGGLYASLDRRLSPTERTIRRAGRVVAAVLVAAAIGGLAAFTVHVRNPAHFAADQWRSFKHVSPPGQASTHLLELGSNRYDFWRVGLHVFADHPLAGIGSRGFRDAYLQVRRSSETPARAHSVEIDALAETGIVGFALLAGALGLAVAAFARRTRVDTVAVGALGAFACWLAQSSVDWTWSFPAIGVPLFALLGIAAARDDGVPLGVRARLPIAVGATAIAVGAFGLPWLSSRYVRSALSHHDPSQLVHARSLDPISTDPLLAAWVLAPDARAGLAPLETAVRMEPRSPDLLYALGNQQLKVGDTRAARRTLARALALDPHDPGLAAALRQARG